MAWADGSPAPPTLIETAVLKALAECKAASLPEVEAIIRDLTPAARRELPVRVRGDVVEFHFRGKTTGKELNPDILEYVLGLPGKEYETLVVVSKEEVARLDRLGKALKDGFGNRITPPLEMVVAWDEEGEVRIENLRDILGLESAMNREQFLRDLTFYPGFGFGESNVRADPARLPVGVAPARVVVTVRLPTKHAK
jgi:hypothetical protein